LKMFLCIQMQSVFKEMSNLLQIRNNFMAEAEAAKLKSRR